MPHKYAKTTVRDQLFSTIIVLSALFRTVLCVIQQTYVKPAKRGQLYLTTFVPSAHSQTAIYVLLQISAPATKSSIPNTPETWA